jgi:hypothetical protein
MDWPTVVATGLRHTPGQKTRPAGSLAGRVQSHPLLRAADRLVQLSHGYDAPVQRQVLLNGQA